MYVLCLCLCLLINCVEAHNLTLLPVPLFGIVRKSLQATCSLSPSFAASSGFNATRLSFLIRVQHNGEEIPTPNGMMFIVNETTVGLDYPDVQRYFHGGHLVCYVTYGGRRIVSAEQRIQLEDPLTPPVIVDYHVLNWDHLYFAWSENRSGQIYLPVNYSAWYKNSDEWSHYSSCISYHGNECIVEDVFSKAAADKVLFVKVEVSNSLGNRASNELMLPLLLIVKPEKVRNVSPRVLLMPNNTFALNIEFNSPKDGKQLVYLLSLSCNGGTFLTNMQTDSMDEYSISVNIDHIPAYSNCTLLIVAKPADCCNWGVEYRQSVVTGELFPLAAPELCRSCFEIRRRNGSDSIDVLLHFKPLLREMARGLIIEYCVEYIGQRRSIKKLFPARDHPSWLHISGLQSDVDYYFTLRAGNSQGYNDSLKVQPVHISRSDRDPFIAGPTVIFRSQTKVELQWEEVVDAASYFLFWCRRASAHGKVCSDVVQSLKSTVNRSESYIILPEHSSASDYLFGIAVETTSGWSSGIVWSTCIYDVSAVLTQPPIVTPASIESFQITLLLSRPSCPDIVHGLVQFFNVYFCQLGNDHHCAGGTRVMKVDAVDYIERSAKTVTLNGLMPAHSYLVSVETLTEAGTKSSRNSSVIVTTASHRNDLNIVIILIVIIGILLAIIAVGLIYNAFRCLGHSKRCHSAHFHNNVVESSVPGTMDDTTQADYTDYSETTTSSTAPMMKPPAHNSQRLHSRSEEYKPTKMANCVVDDTMQDVGHASPLLVPAVDHRILPPIDEHLLSVSSDNTCSLRQLSSASRTVSPLQGHVNNDSQHTVQTVATVHAVGCSSSMDGITESLHETEHSSTANDLDLPGDAGATFRNDDASYSQSARRSL